jgi:hypothetical protein
MLSQYATPGTLLVEDLHKLADLWKDALYKWVSPGLSFRQASSAKRPRECYCTVPSASGPNMDVDKHLHNLVLRHGIRDG